MLGPMGTGEVSATSEGLRALLERAAARVPRLAPREALAAIGDGDVLVDIRSTATRARDGVVPGAVHVPLTVLQWRLEPGGAHRTPFVAQGARVVLICDHGCSSLLAAASLWEMGVEAADVIGGIVAWRAEGLPLVPAADAPLGPAELQGMRPADG
jgi:rhodanese-related sulfurtransferase